MPATKSTHLVVIVACIVGLSVCLARSSSALQEISKKSSGESESEVRMALSVLPPDPLHPRVLDVLGGYMPLHSDKARKLGRKKVVQLHAMLGDVELVDSWLFIAHLIAINGKSDVASDRLLDFIEDYETPQDADARLHGKILRARLYSIQYLGWSKGRRAEEFLLKAYEKPSGLSVLEEYHRHSHEEEITRGFAEFRIVHRALGKVIFALLEFDPEKYAPLIEADYRKVARDVASFGINTDELRGTTPRLPREYLIASNLRRTYATQLIERDLRDEHGARALAEMSRELRQSLTMKRYALIEETPDADAWWGAR